MRVSFLERLAAIVAESPLVQALAMVIALTLVRVRGWPRRAQYSEGFICAAITFGVDVVLKVMAMSPSLVIPAGIFIGIIGSGEIREAARRFMRRKADPGAGPT